MNDRFDSASFREQGAGCGMAPRSFVHQLTQFDFEPTTIDQGQTTHS
jgi:hypothetical protein